MTFQYYRPLDSGVVAGAGSRRKTHWSFLFFVLALIVGVKGEAAQTPPAEIIVLQARQMIDGTGAMNPIS